MGGVRACVPFHEQMGLLEERGQCGLGLPIWIWLPLAGIVAAIIAAARAHSGELTIVPTGPLRSARPLVPSDPGQPPIS